MSVDRGLVVGSVEVPQQRTPEALASDLTGPSALDLTDSPALDVTDPLDPLERELRRMALLHRRDVVARRRSGARALARRSA